MHALQTTFEDIQFVTFYNFSAVPSRSSAPSAWDKQIARCAWSKWPKRKQRYVVAEALAILQPKSLLAGLLSSFISSRAFNCDADSDWVFVGTSGSRMLTGKRSFRNSSGV
jgi:hypothetical protein